MTRDHAPPPHIEPPAGFRGAFRRDRIARELYAEGAGIARTLPHAVAVPEDAEALGELVRWARREGHSLIPRGSGSGMAAGAVGAGIMVDVSRFTAVGAVDVERRRVVAGAGATRGSVDAAARAGGLRFPVDPSSGAFCTVGGMTATNAAGARSLRFGATRPWVTGVHAVFDDGSRTWVRRGEPAPAGVPAVGRLLGALESIRAASAVGAFERAGVRKESSGYGVAHALAAPTDGDALVELLVGSEGTLALFVEVELALNPAAGATATTLAAFPSLEAATACAVEARDAANGGASACELLDRTFLDVAESRAPTGVPAGADAVLLIEVEGVDGSAAMGANDAIMALCRRHGATEIVAAVDRESERALWTLRHAASPILASLAPRLRSMQFIEDGCVPPDRFPEYVRGVRAALTRFETVGVIFGHAGDAHAHVNPLLDVTHAGWRDRVRGILAEVADLTVRLGGTMAGEHGDGRLRAPLLGSAWPVQAVAAFSNVKAAADPAGVFNTGCKMALPGDDPLASLRHDPDAPPLLPEVRAALDGIERTRAWNRFRLDAVPENSAPPETLA